MTFLILSILFISSNATTSANIQVIPMQQIGEDATGDDGIFGLDLVSIYAASFDGLLMLTVVYESPGEWELYSNITLRNSLEDLYLIQAASSEFNNFVVVYSATSLEDDSLDTNYGGAVFYTEEWRVHTNFTEITFFVDWDDIGGEGPVDLVAWTGRPFDNPDKLPDTGHISFDGVTSVDKIGYLDDPERASTKVVDPTDSSSGDIIFVTSTVTENDDIDSNMTNPTVILPISDSYLIGLVVVYFGYQRKNKKKSL